MIQLGWYTFTQTSIGIEVTPVSAWDDKGWHQDGNTCSHNIFTLIITLLIKILDGYLFGRVKLWWVHWNSSNFPIFLPKFCVPQCKIGLYDNVKDLDNYIFNI